MLTIEKMTSLEVELKPFIVKPITAEQVTQVLVGIVEHPDFRDGLVNGWEAFIEEFLPEVLTEEEMVDEIEHNLTWRAINNDNRACQALGWEPPSFLHGLGWVVGIISRSLTYADGSKREQCHL